MKNPEPYLIKHTRNHYGLTQKQCADLVYSSLNAWTKWEAGARKMHPAFWELFLIKVKNIQDKKT